VADLPSFPDLFRIGKTEALVRNRRLSPEEIDRQGSDLNILLAAPAAMADECIGQLAGLRADLFSGTARGDALDRLITDRYPDLIRKQAAPSYGYLTFSYSPAVSSAFTIPDGTVASTADGIQFITVGSAAVATGATSTRVPIRSVLAGANQKATAGKITNLISTLSGAPTSGMTVSNVTATAGGEDKETDGDYVVRYQKHYLAARRATTGAIEQAVLGVPGIVKATVYENLDTLGRPIGYVQVVVSDSFTEQFLTTSVLPATYATQLASLTTQIQSTLREWRAAGIGVTVTFASVVIQTVRLLLSYVAGADESAVNNIVLARIVQKINTLPPGQSLALEDLRSILRTTSGVFYTGGEVLSPVGDVVVQPQQVLRTSSTFVTIGA
jgi:uncharacterized phage protein gp47/JayE